MPEHARPTVTGSLRVSAVWLALWLVPVIAIIATLGSGNLCRDRRVFRRWRSSLSAAPMRLAIGAAGGELITGLLTANMMDGSDRAETTPAIDHGR